MQKAVAFFFVFLLLLPIAGEAANVPALRGYVNDYGNMISPSVEADLAVMLKKFEESDSTQVVILTVPSLGGDPIEDYSIKVAETWKIGQKGKDNGILFLVSRDDRKMRIEVGRGLEGKLTDLTAGRIIDLVVKPKFKTEDYDGGFAAGVSALIDATRGEFTADRQVPSRGPKSAVPFVGGLSPLLLILIQLVLFVFFIAIARSRARRSAMSRNELRRRGGYLPFPGGYHESGWSTGGGGDFGSYLRLMPAVYLIFLSLALTTALALLFSTFSTPALSAVFTLFLWVAGHFNRDLLDFGKLTESAAFRWFCNVLYYLLPNISNFNSIDGRNVIQSAAYHQSVDPAAVMWISVYALLYCAVLLLLSIAIFSRRDFK